MTIDIIAAVTLDGAIGIHGDLLYHISDDLRRFRQTTMGHPIIMGRKTFQSFPKGPLPGRRNIIVSRDSAFTAPGAEVYTSLTDAITAAAATSPRAFIIGGGQLYRQAIGLADNLLLTVIETHRPDADTFFPDIDPATWIETDHGTPSIDPRSGLSFRFACLSRR